MNTRWQLKKISKFKMNDVTDSVNVYHMKSSFSETQMLLDYTLSGVGA